MLKHIFFEILNIYFFRKRNVQNMLGYWPYATPKRIFFFVFLDIYIYVCVCVCVGARAQKKKP